jgi:polyisoprenoid-binding protein YceI
LKLIRAIRVSVLLTLLLTLGVAARAQELLVEPASSEVHFTLGDVLHTVHGTFKISEGHLQLRPASGEMSGLIAVSTASGESGNGARDRRMKDSELEAQKYPLVSFQPQKFSGTLAPSGKSSITVTGVFTLLGVAHTISVPMQVEATGERYTASASFNVPYVAWGLKDPSTFVLRVAKEVQIDLKLVAAVKH